MKMKILAVKKILSYIVNRFITPTTPIMPITFICSGNEFPDINEYINSGGTYILRVIYTDSTSYYLLIKCGRISMYYGLSGCYRDLYG